MDVINLYTMSGCPRCNVLKQRCKQSRYITTTDFKFVNINPQDKSDTDLQTLTEKGFTNLPVMLVNNDYYTFDAAMRFLHEKDALY